MRIEIWRSVLVAVGTIVVLGGVMWFVAVPVSEWAVGPQTPGMTRVEWLAAVHNVRSSLVPGLSVLAGIVVAGIGVGRYFLDRHQQRLEQDKHLVAQFDSAWGRLAAEEPVIRANAVRTLFRLMTDSERDRPLVLRSVCDLLRQRSGRRGGTDHPEPDVVAAVDTLRERPRRDEPDPLDLSGVRLPAADLGGAVLRGAQIGGDSVLTSANLSRADLRDAVLEKADLTDADLRAATLSGARLAGAICTSTVLAQVSAADADLSEASLRDADLTGADLQGARLGRAECRGATFHRADLTGADLADADLTGADLTTATGLTREAIAAAVTDSSTGLPPHIQR